MGVAVNIDGKLFAPEDALISVFDRGFLYGDSVYEVLRTYRGRPFQLPAHLSRLIRSAERIGLPLPRPVHEIAEEIERTLTAARNEESYLRVVCTRGGGDVTLDPAAAAEPRLVIFALPLKPVPRQWYEEGVTAAVVSVRRNLKEAVDPAAKTGNYLNNILALREARQKGADEAVMLDHRGRVTEGSSCNLFFVKDGVVRTPAMSVGILDGITRDRVLELARAEGIVVEEGELYPEEFARADEVFLTSTLREVLPITRWDGSLVGSGRPGPITRRLHAALRRLAGAE